MGARDRLRGPRRVIGALPRAAAFLADSQVPVNMAVFGEPVTVAAWRDRPSWAVIATEDKAFDQAMLNHMADRAGAAVTHVPGSHPLFMTQADAVADVIDTAARSARATG